MKGIAIGLLVLFVWLAAADASAGRIFGDIKMEGKPVPAGIMVTLAPAPPDAEGAGTPAAGAADTILTDEFGSYKLNVKAEGKCTLTLVYEKQSLSLEVFSYKKATRYDLILEKTDGKLVLRRR